MHFENTLLMWVTYLSLTRHKTDDLTKFKV